MRSFQSLPRGRRYLLLSLRVTLCIGHCQQGRVPSLWCPEFLLGLSHTLPCPVDDFQSSSLLEVQLLPLIIIFPRGLK